MKRLTSLILVGVLLATGSAIAVRATAGETENANGSPAAAKELDHYTGKVKAVDADERSLVVMNFWSTRTFNLGEDCRVTVEGREAATPQDLLPGHRIEVAYEEVDGVRIASVVAQRDLRFEGKVAALDTNEMILRVKHGWTTREFKATPDSEITFRDGSQHPLGDLEPGQSVTVRYYTPAEDHLALKIEQRSLEFTGRVEVLDADRERIQAGSLLADRTFELSDDCVFVVNGKAEGTIEDLQIGDRVTFFYEDIDGVAIASKVVLESTGEISDRRQPGSRAVATY